MYRGFKLVKIVLFTVLILLLIGCGPSAEDLAVTYVAETVAAASPTPTETPEPTATFTSVPTETVRPTQTPKATNTLIPTHTPIPATSTPVATATKASSSGGGSSAGGGFSSGCTGNGCHNFKVNNKTGEAGSITLWGEKGNYYFYVPTGMGHRFSIYPGLYTYRIEYCGNVYGGSHTLNSNWFIDMKCP